MQITNGQRTDGGQHRRWGIPIAIVCLAITVPLGVAVAAAAGTVWVAAPSADLEGLAAATAQLPFDERLVEQAATLPPVILTLAIVATISLLTSRGAAADAALRKTAWTSAALVLIILLAMVAGTWPVAEALRQGGPRGLDATWFAELLASLRGAAGLAFAAAVIWVCWTPWAITRLHRIDEAGRLEHTQTAAPG